MAAIAIASPSSFASLDEYESAPILSPKPQVAAAPALPPPSISDAQWPFLDALTHTHTDTHSRTRVQTIRALFMAGVYACVMSIGVCSTTQAALNSRLGAASGAGIYGALACYVIGSGILLCVCVLHTHVTGTRFFHVHTHAAPKWYELAGGVCGALYMITAVYLTPIVGVALFFALVVAGQLSASLALDHTGFAGLPVSRATKSKLLALGVAVAGVVASAVGGIDADADGAQSDDDDVPSAPPRPPTGVLVVYCLVIAVAGALQPMQSVLNWRLGRLLPNKLQAVSLSFFVATLVAFVVALTVFIASIPTLADINHNLRNTSWWMWMGALAQICVLAGGVVFPPRITTSLYYMLLLLGELCASLIYDDVGAFDLPERKATTPRIIGLCLVMAGSTLMHYAKVLSDAVSHYSDYVSRLRGAAVLRVLHTSASSRTVMPTTGGDEVPSRPQQLSWLSTLRKVRWSFSRDSPTTAESTPLFSPMAASPTPRSATARTHHADGEETVDGVTVATRTLSVSSAR